MFAMGYRHRNLMEYRPAFFLGQRGHDWVNPKLITSRGNLQLSLFVKHPNSNVLEKKCGTVIYFPLFVFSFFPKRIKTCYKHLRGGFVEVEPL